eukprot:m.3618 g.3618  ORF g.3618 m.3618 type:complete len:217 (+) comp9632_c0_seq2:308-958(+)
MASANHVRRSTRRPKFRQVAEQSQSVTLKYILRRLNVEHKRNAEFSTRLNGFRSSVVEAAARRFDDNPLVSTVMRLALTIEKRYTVEFEDMCDRLLVKRETIQSTFVDVVREIFRDGINYGRIAAVFSFGGALAVHSIKLGIHDALEKIPLWTGDFVEEYLAEWIEAHGGWDGFVAHFNGRIKVESERSIWEKAVTVGGMVAAGAAGLALFALKYT